MTSATRRRLEATALAGVCLVTTARSAAAPQVNVGVSPGLTWHPGAKVAFDGSVSADALFGRSGDASFGVGPRFEIGTRAFDDLRLGGGLTALAPLDPLALTATVHGLAVTHECSVNPGLGGRLFLGLRPYNYYGWYSAGLGITAGVDHVFGPGTTSLTLALQLDGMWLSLPFLFVAEALLH